MNSISPLYQNEISRESEVIPRQSVFEGNIKKYQTNFNSKWANLKTLLQNKTSLELSVNTLKKNTIEQFSSKIHKIYEKKILINQITENNSGVFFQSYKDFSVKKINILDGSNNLSYYDNISFLLFELRSNNNLMLHFIDSLSESEYNLMIPFLCHFFYENFYMESTEQEEMLYIIYLLLEKEIDRLNTPSINSFLDDSFISKFLFELSNRYEIKCYINLILNSLIRKIEDENLEYHSLDLSKENKKTKNEVTTKISQSIIFDRSTSFSNNSRGDYIDDMRNTENFNNRTLIRQNLDNPFDRRESQNQNFQKLFNITLNEYEMRKLFQDKTDPFQRELLLKHLRYSITSKNPNLFSNDSNKSKFTQENISQYTIGYKMIIDFIDELFYNLENETIIPYSIKVICKIIYVLIKQKFKFISDLERDIFVGAFFFDKLILPVLLNPDINETGYNTIISMSTRKNIYNIYLVLKKFSKAELFTSDTSPHYTIFNQYIIDNIQKIDKFIVKLTKVDLPAKLKQLSELYYDNDLYVLNEEEKDPKLITYDYFEENKKDFMQHQSICFNIEQLIMIINKLFENELYKYVPNNTLFKELCKKLHDFKDFLQNQTSNDEQQFYVIMNDKYPPEVKELLSKKEEIIPLVSNNDSSNYLNEIKYCICHLLTHFEILPHWEWVTGNYKTETVFELIDKYLSHYNNDIILPFNSTAPLCWYSMYIKSNINKIPQEYKNNDYQKLHDEIVEEFKSTMKKLNKLNDFLTIQITTKFILIDHKINITDEELKNIKSTQRNIKTEFFIERKTIPVLLASKYEINNERMKRDKDKYVVNSESSKISELICVKDTNEKYEKNIKMDFKNDKEFLLHLDDNTKKIYRCETINDFAERFSNYDSIYLDIHKTSLDSKRESITKAKEVLETYINIIKEELIKFFYPNYEKLESKLERTETTQERDAINNQLNFIKEEIEIQSKSIWNYILKRLYSKKYSEVPIKEDLDLNKKCRELFWIDPVKHLSIKENVFEKNIFQTIIKHIKNMDKLSSPLEKLNEFGRGVQLINSLYLFTGFKSNTDADDFIPFVIYALILCQPKRLFWSLMLIKFFLNANELFGNIGYNVSQAEGAAKYILNLDYNKLHCSKSEYDDNCRKYRFFDNNIN